MPFVYHFGSRDAADPFVTSGSGGTQVDSFFIKPGATRPVALIALRGQGRGAALTSLSGISLLIKQYTSTAASGGTSVTPAPVDKRAPAAVCTMGGASGGVTVGTGGPTQVGGIGFGASGPGGWQAPNPDAAIALDGGATMSTDLFSCSGSASMNYEFWGEVQE